MQAVVLHPVNHSFEIIRGDLSAIRAAYTSREMTTHGIIGTDNVKDRDDFLEWCFDHTNTNEKYKETHKTRGMGVGDVLVVFDDGAYACMPSGWERIE